MRHCLCSHEGIYEPTLSAVSMCCPRKKDRHGCTGGSVVSGCGLLFREEQVAATIISRGRHIFWWHSRLKQHTAGQV